MAKAEIEQEAVPVSEVWRDTLQRADRVLKQLPRSARVAASIGLIAFVSTASQAKEGIVELPSISPVEGKETTLELSAAQIPVPDVGVPEDVKSAPDYFERFRVQVEAPETEIIPSEKAPEEVKTEIERTTLVYPGDTLIGIGERLGVSWQEVAKLNRIEPPYTIYWGQQLIIPGREESLGQYFEKRSSIIYEANADFNDEERKWINETAVKITKLFTNVVGPSFKTGIVPIERGRPGEFHTNAWCYGPSEEYPVGVIRFREDHEIGTNIENYAHEISHLWLAGWEFEMAKVFGDIGIADSPHDFVDILAEIAVYQLGEIPHSDLGGDIPIQAYWRDPDFYLKLRKRLEEEGKPAGVSQGQWQRWAEEASPGFNAWLEMVKEGPEVELPEPTGKTFVWSEKAAEVAENNPSQIPFHPEWMAGPVEWFMPWFLTGKGRSERVGENRYLVYRTVAGGIFYPEVGPEGSLPYYRDDPFGEKPLGEWR